jgi:Uracil DNA glycosylase superfamily
VELKSIRGTPRDGLAFMIPAPRRLAAVYAQNHYPRSTLANTGNGTAGRPCPGLPSPPVRTAAERRELLKDVYEEARGCTRCALHQTRTTVVFGAGNADADLMFIGEAPGANEDRMGLPFVGQAGKLLDKLLAEIGLERTDVFIANTLKC